MSKSGALTGLSATSKMIGIMIMAMMMMTLMLLTTMVTFWRRAGDSTVRTSSP